MRENKAITLIALVVTIIVLLILASVSLNLVLGEHGIITMAKVAKENMELAQVEEQTALNSLYEQLYGNNIKGSGNSGNTQGGGTEQTPKPKSEVEQAKDAKTYFEEQTTLQDSDGNQVVVPEGFKIAEDSGNNVTEGIVIEDDDIKEGIGQGRGNQYVWIPVSNIDGSDSNPIKKSDGTEVVITLGRYTFSSDGTETLKQNAADYNKAVLIYDSYQELATYQQGIVDNINGQNQTAKNLSGFVNSVRDNKGYYIARYEASYGTDKKPNSKVSDYANNKDSYIPEKEGDLWNNILQQDAAKACSNLYTIVKSDLVNSYAWDTAIIYIQKFSNETSYSNAIPCSTDGNTGTSKDEICKINDMSSNCMEWTTETWILATGLQGHRCVTIAGSGYYNSTRVIQRTLFHCDEKAIDISFRPILYI